MLHHPNARTDAHKAPRRHPHPSNAPAPSVSLARNVLKSVGISLLTALASLLVLSTAAYLTPDPASILSPLGILASALTAFIGGFCAVKLHKKNALLCGLSNGCAMMAVMLVASLFFRDAASAYSPLVSCLFHIGFLLLSVLGAFAALPRTGAKAKRRSSRRR